MEFDVLIVGAGPAGLSAAITLKQQSPNMSICVLEKGAAVGSHILSGAVLDPRALSELIPDWQSKSPPNFTPVTNDHFMLLTAQNAYQLPTPKPMQNQGNYIISLGALCQWLAAQAEELGVQIFPGFAATELIINDDQVSGVKTGAMGIDKTGHPGSNYQPGIALYANHTLLAEGCRGSLTKQVMHRFGLTKQSHPQTYAIGIKEVWEVSDKQYQPGQVMHTIGWPLDNQTYGGSFIYHMTNNRVALGFVIGLDYRNPYLDPFQELQRFKTHPKIAPLFNQGQRIAYGARALVEGGWQSLPQLEFPGGLLIGDCAGFLNVPKIKGIHMAMKSGILAAQSITQQTNFQVTMTNSWLGQELKQTRNIRPGFNKGLWAGLANAAISTYIFHGKEPWTLRHKKADYEALNLAKNSQKINYPKPDNKLTFDKLSSVYLTNTHHNENQPCHLQLLDPEIAINVNYEQFASPETRYCPANVYEIIKHDGKPTLQINFTNCIHCKTCDIKDPKQNINWVTPEGGDGPNYTEM